ncbi:MAG: hypothetical protein BWK76_17020 [Desulfobulbaceae bacterium A2]|nr:MAG: hypothetical protein BWK76_17020 [Desulfobulbaceae bacterium A2]
MLRVNGHIGKTTLKGRLSDVNAVLEKYLTSKQLHVHELLDVAVSSGITAWEWLQSLSAAGRKVRITATDLVLEAFLVTIGPCLRVLTDIHGNALQYDVLGLGIRPGRPRPRDFLGGQWVLSLFMRGLWWRYKKQQLRLSDAAAGEGCFDCDPRQGIRIRLISQQIPEAPNPLFVQDDLFAPLPSEFLGRFDVVRAANILNLAYFPSEKIVAVSRRLKHCCRPGGILLVCRTWEDGSNHGTIFCLGRNDALRAVVRFGCGSEVESQVLQA